MSKHHDAFEKIQERTEALAEHLRLKADTLHGVRRLHETIDTEILASALAEGVERMARRSHDAIKQSFKDLLWFHRRSIRNLTQLHAALPKGRVGEGVEHSREVKKLLRTLSITKPIMRRGVTNRLKKVKAFIARLEAEDVAVSQETWDSSLVLNREFRELFRPDAFLATGLQLTERQALEWSVFVRAGLSEDPSDDLWRPRIEEYDDDVLKKLRPDPDSLDGYIVGVPLRTLFLQTFQGDLVESEFGEGSPSDATEVRHERWVEAVDRCLIRIGQAALERCKQLEVGEGLTRVASPCGVEDGGAVLSSESLARLDVPALHRLTDLDWITLKVLAGSGRPLVTAAEIADRCRRGKRTIEAAKKRMNAIHQPPLVRAQKGTNGGYGLTEAGRAAVSWHRDRKQELQ